ncbi:hypothetical protein [Nevskia soli]|uniref:hypothetical protein n=1 Tax=Nevskia soli TaxID=418856 RepID=UPI0012F732D7|nr:hypothetical protein [Nevskia soli]
MTLIPDFIGYPRTLIVAAVVCLPALPAIARYFFEDFDTFKHDAWLDNSAGRWGWLLGLGRIEYTLDWRMLGFVGAYAGLVAAVYQLLVKLQHWLHAGAT